MGKVVVKNVILKNYEDEIAVKLGVKSKNEIRSMSLDMIAGTGARVVGLPMSLVEQLGLPAHREVKATLSNGNQEKRTLYKNLQLQIGDRESVFECLSKPEGAPCLIGQLVLETLDFVVDCPNHRIIPNPEAPEGMMLYDDF